MASETLVREPRRGTAIWMLGGLHAVKASGPDTGGALTVIEPPPAPTVPPGRRRTGELGAQHGMDITVPA